MPNSLVSIGEIANVDMNAMWPISVSLGTVQVVIELEIELYSPQPTNSFKLAVKIILKRMHEDKIMKTNLKISILKNLVSNGLSMSSCSGSCRH